MKNWASDAPEGGGSNAALLDVSFERGPFKFHLRVTDPETVRSLSSKVANALGFGLAAAGIGIGLLCYKHPEFVMKIVEKVFTAPGLEVGCVTPSSILVECIVIPRRASDHSWKILRQEKCRSG